MGRAISKGISIDSAWLDEFAREYPKEFSKFSRTIQILLRINYPLGQRTKIVRQRVEVAKKLAEINSEMELLKLKKEELLDFMSFLEKRKKGGSRIDSKQTKRKNV